VTSDAGSHELPGALHYSPHLNVAPHHSPFRPARIGPFQVNTVEVTPADVWVHTTGGTVRLPPEMVGYSWRPA
jgi:hypothetical protein